MTLETAKRIIREQGEQANKEALAVVRGGMIYIERTKDGRRRAPWIEVLPTKTDEESSIDNAIENYRKGKHAQPRKIKQAPVQQVTNVNQETYTQNRVEKTEALPPQPSLYERLKKKAIIIWHEIDSIVIE